MPRRPLRRGPLWGYLLSGACCLLPLRAEALPILGAVPERSYTLGPSFSFDFDTGEFLFGVEGALARRIYWLSGTARLFSGAGDIGGALLVEGGLNMVVLNVGLGYQARVGEELRHGPALSAAIPIPLADPKRDDKRILGAVPYLSPYYRLSFIFGGGFESEIGIALKLWWKVRTPPP
jgi:hypothetical protein